MKNIFFNSSTDTEFVLTSLYLDSIFDLNKVYIKLVISLLNYVF